MQDNTTDDAPTISEKSPEPVNRESRFGYNELFFSVTDPKSTITYANDLFIKISKYEQQEISGQYHSVVRHPDMPRSVFYIYWDLLKQNKPVAAYVKNMAKDGSYYWVMALAFPCDGGYLSVRLKPGSNLFDKIKKLYGRVLDHEKEIERKTDKETAMHSSRDILMKELHELGYTDYNEFMWSALQSEMEHREAILEGEKEFSNKSGEYIPNELINLEKILRELVLILGDLKQLHLSIVSHSEYILNLSRSVLLLSKNAQVSSAKLDSQDRSLSVVAEKMGEQAVSGENQLLDMQDNISHLSELIRSLSFNIISSKLQAEMTKSFITEIEVSTLSRDAHLISEDKALDLLYNAFVPKVDEIAEEIGQLPDYLKKLLSGVREIERFLLILRFVHIKGKVEIARMNDQAKSFSNTFEELIKEVDAAETRLEKLGDIIRKHESTGILFAGYKGQLLDLGEKLSFTQRKQPQTDKSNKERKEAEATA